MKREEIIAALEEGRVGEELDFWVMAALHPELELDDRRDHGGSMHLWDNSVRPVSCVFSVKTAPPVSTSLDAVASLADAILPGWGYRVYSSGDGVFECQMSPPDRSRRIVSTGPSECGARLAALLRSLEEG